MARNRGTSALLALVIALGAVAAGCEGDETVIEEDDGSGGGVEDEGNGETEEDSDDGSEDGSDDGDGSGEDDSEVDVDVG